MPFNPAPAETRDAAVYLLLELRTAREAGRGRGRSGERSDTGEGRHTELTSVGANEDPLSTVHTLMHTHTHSNTPMRCPLPGDSELTVCSLARCEPRQLLNFSNTQKGQQGVKETLEKHAAQLKTGPKRFHHPFFPTGIAVLLVKVK